MLILFLEKEVRKKYYFQVLIALVVFLKIIFIVIFAKDTIGIKEKIILFLLKKVGSAMVEVLRKAKSEKDFKNFAKNMTDQLLKDKIFTIEPINF